MGDGITTTFDLVMFFLIFVGIPIVIVGLPIVILGVLAVRQYTRSQREREKTGKS